MRRALLAALLASFSAEAFASGAGTTAAPFLTLGAGARPTAMSGAYAGLADGAAGLAYNPAGLGMMTRDELVLAHEELAYRTHHEWAGFALPRGSIGTFAVSANLLVVDPFDAYDNLDQPNGKVSAMDGAYELAYGVSPTESLSFGAAVKEISSRLDDRTATSVAFDAGVLARPTDWLGIGASILNAGGGLRYIDVTEPLPFVAKAGLAIIPFEDRSRRLTLTLDTEFPRGGSPQAMGGLEFVMLDAVALRAGAHSDVSDQPGFSVGGGLILNRSAADRVQLSFDYALVDRGSLGYAHQGSLTLRFGAAVERDEDSREGRERPASLWRWRPARPMLTDDQPEVRRTSKDLSPDAPRAGRPGRDRSKPDTMHDTQAPDILWISQ